MSPLFQFHTIAIAKTPYTEKFGIPRQPGLVDQAFARIEFQPPFNRKEAIEGIETSSHLWLSFIFHDNCKAPSSKGLSSSTFDWSPSVRPPRLGGNKKMGVFATRAPVRPNPLGLSVVKLEAIENNGGVLALIVSGIDLLDGTPIVDIKPYIPYCDSVANAHNDFATEQPQQLNVIFSTKANEQIPLQDKRLNQRLKPLLEQILSQDPRPKYHKTDSERIYAMKLFDLDIHWRCLTDSGAQTAVKIEVVEITRL